MGCRRRVARGCGREEREVTELLGVFINMRAQMQGMSRLMALGSANKGVCVRACTPWAAHSELPPGGLGISGLQRFICRSL